MRNFLIFSSSRYTQARARMRSLIVSLVKCMRFAALCFCLCGMASLASAEHRIQVFNGVTARFRLLNRSLRLNEPLNVRLTLRNSSDHPVEFRYFRLLQHIDVFGSNGERVMIKLNAPFFESPADKIRLKPGETLHRTESIRLSTLYDLAPGDYSLCFKYDLRLLPANIRKSYQETPHSHLIAWDDTGYELHIRP